MVGGLAMILIARLCLAATVAVVLATGLAAVRVAEAETADALQVAVAMDMVAGAGVEAHGGWSVGTDCPDGPATNRPE